ncbi:Fbox domain containing protein [Acanthamoeba castellanii str. Neff]|uniref:Fbox domain containing protein n=1 Tax=Acanthamoeba castellanii (strain ATCC 30010 / Neff) TaxID=1257118 RepID=L8HLM8_ACACF|nr:Fbox domain containing protein [Acanthamoeba castellanii str. Neff]ELR25573.1 Fbox domain containing protein [Acanthamoeba castellanii str. Neff]
MIETIQVGTADDAQGGALCDPLGHVPPELAIHVLSYLTDAELAHAASVCRDWYGLANDDHVWRERFKRRFDKGAEGRKAARARRRGLPGVAAEGDEEAIETERLVLDDPRLDDMLTTATTADLGDLESGAAHGETGDDEAEDEEEGEGDVDDEEETEELEGIRRLVIPSPLSNSAKWKTLYVERHMQPQIKLLRILSENTSLGRLMDKNRLRKIEATILNPNRMVLERLGKYPHLVSAFAAKRSLIQTKLEFLQHITNNLVCCLLGLIVWCCVEVFFPDFFDYPYLFIPFTWYNLGRFWLLFAYAAVLCVAYNWLLPQPTSLRRTIFLWSAANSILAGLLEECGFRFLYICTAMLSILAVDYAIKGVMMALAGLMLYATVISVVGIVRRPINQLTRREALSIAITAAMCGLFAYLSTFFVVMGVYEMFIVPGTNFITLGHFEDIFYDESRRLFVIGMLAANGWFRDSHKYTGVLGWANAWIIGFVMMYACLHYGLMLTIVVHALYDLEFVVLSFVLSSARTHLGCLPTEPLLPIVVS